MASKRLLAMMDPEERNESRKERMAEKKNPKLEAKEKFLKRKVGKK